MQRGDASEEVTKERMKGSKKTAGVKSSKRVEKQKPQTKVFLLHFYDLGKGRVEESEKGDREGENQGAEALSFYGIRLKLR